mgnify:CR=1 FL=1
MESPEVTKSLEALRRYWGVDGDEVDRRVDVAASAVEGLDRYLGNREAREVLEESGLNNDPRVVVFLYRLAATPDQPCTQSKLIPAEAQRYAKAMVRTKVSQNGSLQFWEAIREVVQSLYAEGYSDNP